jgi:prepilin-type processing-associated H-X9-DG protein
MHSLTYRGQDLEVSRLQLELANLPRLRAENKELREISLRAEELKNLREENNEIPRLQKEVGELRLNLAQETRERMSRLEAEDERLAGISQQLEESPETIRSRQVMDMTQLRQIAEAFSAYIGEHDGELPANFSDLRRFVSAGVWSTLETSRFEILLRGRLDDIAAPDKTPIVRSISKDKENQRAYLFADGHVEMRTDQ